MRLLLGLLTIALLSVDVSACGGTGKRTGSASQSPSSASVEGNAGAGTASRATPAGGYVRGDDDADETNHKDEDDYGTRNYGRAASTTEERGIVALVNRYYTAAAAGDGAKACGVLYRGLVSSPNLGEAAEVAYPPAPGVPPLRGQSCARIMSLLFKEDRRQLAADVATVEVTDVRVKGNGGIALLGFGTRPERQIPVRREHGGWKIDALLDKELP